MFASLRITKIVGVFGFVAMFGMAGSASAVITGSAHDLSKDLVNAEKEICVYCHTPHGGETDAPLWNRDISTPPTYVAYSSDTMDATVGQPVGISLACLSCHDGTVAFSTLVKEPLDSANNPDTMNVIDNPTAFLGLTLSNQHPVSIAMADAGAGFVGTTPTSLPLYGGNVECGSCHDPHDTTNGKFLRMSNGDSGLCKDCHAK